MTKGGACLKTQLIMKRHGLLKSHNSEITKRCMMGFFDAQKN